MTEFGFIGHIKNSSPPCPTNEFEGIGDDCAVLPVGGGRIAGLHDRHARRRRPFPCIPQTSPRELGRKSLAVNLSDVADGRPPGGHPAVAVLPADAAGIWAEKSSCSAAGNSPKRSASRSPGRHDPLGGRHHDQCRPSAHRRHIKRRGRARPGDAILSPENSDFRAPGCATSSPGATTPRRRSPPQPAAQVAEGIWLAHAPKYTP